MKSFRQIGLVINLMFFSLTVAAAQNDPGQAYFNRGQFELAAQYWAEALSTENNSKRYIDTSVRLSAAYLSLGRLKEAFHVLESAQNVADKIDDPVRKASLLMQFSDVYLAMRDFQENRMDCGMKKITENIISSLEEKTSISKGMINKALYYLDKSQEIATEIDPERKKYPLLWANILNKQGNVLSVQVVILEAQGKKGDAQKKYSSEVLPKYKESLQFAEQTDDSVLSAKILINIIHGAVQAGLAKKVMRENEQQIKTILQHVKKLPDSHDKAFTLLRLVQLIQNIWRLSSKKMRHPLSSKASSGEKNVNYCQLRDQLKIFKNKKHKQWFAYCTLMDALEVAETQRDNLSIIYAKFYLAQLYQETKNYAQAIQLIRQALFYAKNYPQLHKKLQSELWGYPALIFRLEWHLGNFLKAQKHDNHQKTTIGDAYERAHKHLQLVRKGYGSLSQAFLNEAKQFYFDWADFLLQQAYKISDDSEKQKQLKEAIKVVEWFEAAEVRDYFRDDCITRKLEEKVRHLDDNLPSNVAIFYPLLFDDRIELLLISKDKKIKQETYPHTNIKKIETTIDNFRGDLSYYGNCGGSGKAEIYQWFEPIMTELDELGIDTLIIVPHGKLYTIPFAALYDGKEFLIEKYALMVTPGIKLTDTIQSQQRDINALLNGLSVSVDGLPKLCNVPGEIINISYLLGDKQGKLDDYPFIKNCLNDRKKACNSGDTGTEANRVLLQSLKENRIDCGSRNDWMSYPMQNKKDNNIVILQDEDFTLYNVKKMLSEKIPYSIVHFATHGKFSSAPDETFLQAFDGRITMKSLNELILINHSFRTQPVDLLTLSACETAKGDERAALGLASVAIQAGVPRALATLWSIDDSATTRLMTDFYRYSFNSSKDSKAEALRKAQLKLLNSNAVCGKNKDKYEDPYLWAPFLLIGNGLKE